MKYVFNPRNLQINPVTEMTLVDSTLRDKVVSSELYALVCKGKVSISDIAAMFAVGKSPEILVKNHAAIKDSPLAKAPAAPVTLPPEAPLTPPGGEGAGDEGEKPDANGAFDGKSLYSKKTAELLVIATTIGCPELQDPEFAPVHKNLIAAIKAKAAAAEASKAPDAPVAPANPLPAAE